MESVLERIKLFGCWEGVGEEEGERENCCEMGRSGKVPESLRVCAVFTLGL